MNHKTTSKILLILVVFGIGFLSTLATQATNVYMEDFEFNDDIKLHGFEIYNLDPSFANISITDMMAFSGQNSLWMRSLDFTTPQNPLILNKPLNMDVNNVSSLFVSFNVFSETSLNGVFRLEVSNGTHNVILEYGRLIQTRNDQIRMNGSTIIYSTNITFVPGTWNSFNRSILGQDIKNATNHPLFPYQNFNIKYLVNYHIMHDVEADITAFWDAIAINVQHDAKTSNGISYVVDQILVLGGIVALAGGGSFVVYYSVKSSVHYLKSSGSQSSSSMTTGKKVLQPTSSSISTQYISFALNHAGLDFYNITFTNQSRNAIQHIQFELQSPKLGKILDNPENDLSTTQLEPQTSIKAGFICITPFGQCTAKIRYTVAGEDQVVEVTSDNPTIQTQYIKTTLTKLFSTKEAAQVLSGFSSIPAGIKNLVQDELKDISLTKLKDLVTEWNYTMIVLNNPTDHVSRPFTIQIKKKFLSSIVNLQTPGEVTRFEDHIEITLDRVNPGQQVYVTFIGVSPKKVDFVVKINRDYGLEKGIPMKIDTIDVMWQSNIGKELATELNQFGHKLKSHKGNTEN